MTAETLLLVRRDGDHTMTLVPVSPAEQRELERVLDALGMGIGDEQERDEEDRS